MADPWIRALGFETFPVRLVELGILVFARTLPLVFLSPFLGSRMAPRSVRVAVTLALTCFAVPFLAGVGTAVPGVGAPGLSLLALVVKELAVGLTLGLVTALVFEGFASAGRLVDLGRGANAAEAHFPHLDAQPSALSRLFAQGAVVVFLLAGGHLVWLHAYATSFLVLPVHAFPGFSEGTLPLLRDLAATSGRLLLIALQFAAPALLAIFLTDVVFGIAGRLAAPLPSFLVAQPAKAAIGLFFVLLAMRGLISGFDLEAREMLVAFYRLSERLGG